MKKRDPREQILQSNMNGNDIAIVCENTNSWKTTMPFEKDDCIVDMQGNIIERGDAPKHASYRKAFTGRKK